jgi:hypothetical protein
MIFHSLGQVIHLVQDAAQPQHTRNDAHLDPSESVVMQWLPLLEQTKRVRTIRGRNVGVADATRDRSRHHV